MSRTSNGVILSPVRDVQGAPLGNGRCLKLDYRISMHNDPDRYRLGQLEWNSDRASLTWVELPDTNVHRVRTSLPILQSE